MIEYEVVKKCYPMVIQRLLINPISGSIETWIEVWNSPEEEIILSEKFMKRWKEVNPEEYALFEHRFELSEMEK